MNGKIRTAVVGVGHFGARHAEKYAALAESDLVAVADLDEAKAKAVGGRFGVAWMRDWRDLVGKVDAVSVAVPTAAHHEVAQGLLEAGVHVLVEKPIADTPERGRALADLAERNALILAAGHIERHSALFEALLPIVTRPLYIECYRISPFSGRGVDVNVVLDLMIHDIDLLMALVDAPLQSVDAVGAPVVSPHEDIVNTRLIFANGCVANVTASRISHKVERTMRIFQPDEYTVVDFQNSRLTRVRGTAGDRDAKSGRFERVDETVEAWDALEREIASFLGAVAHGSPVRVTGRHAAEAVHAAVMIENSLLEHRARLGL